MSKENGITKTVYEMETELKKEIRRLEDNLRKLEAKFALKNALEKSDIPDGLIPEPLDKAINPDPCEHEFFGDYCKSSKKVELVNWKCKKCGLVITDNDVTIILNRFADIENWLND